MRIVRRVTTLAAVLITIAPVSIAVTPAAASSLVQEVAVRTAVLPTPDPAVDLDGVVAVAVAARSAAQVGTAPGQYAQSAADSYQAAIDTAQDRRADPGADQHAAALTLIDAGKAFLGSVVTSDAVVDSSQNLLAYSSYRRDLDQLVFEAQAILKIRGEFYTQAAKTALQDQIDWAKSALAGEGDVPFVRNRQFLTPRADEAIRFTTEYFSRAPSYGSSTWGLKPALAWYRNQHILRDTFSTIELTPSDDTFIHSGTPTTTRGTAASLIVGNGRTSFFMWDLHGVPAGVEAAAVRLVNNSANNNKVYLNLETNDAWSETGLTFNTWPRDSTGQPITGPRLADAQSGARNSAFTVDVTGAAAEQQRSDGMLSLSLTQDLPRTGLFPLEVFSKEAAAATQRPALVVTTSQVDQAKLAAKYDKVIGLAQQSLDGATVGSAVGQYPQDVMDAVHAAIDAAAGVRAAGNAEEAGLALIAVYDATSAMRSAEVLRSDIQPTSTLFMADGGIQDLRERINRYPALKAEYDKLKVMSDTKSLEDIKGLDILMSDHIDYTQANTRYKLWATTANQNFTPPTGAVSAQLQVTLPSAENETQGLGHAWVDDFRIYSATSVGDLPIQNAGAESGAAGPDNWQPTAISGSPVVTWETGANLTNSGSRALYLQNPTATDQAGWTNTQDIPIQAGVSHTLSYAAKIDGKLKTGLNVVLKFKDANGNFIVGSTGTFTSTTNLTSNYGPANFNLLFQTDALVYAVSGDTTYAQKAKHRMFWFLNDQLQGVENWLVNNARPDNIDAYGAVQNGRNATSLSSAYSLIKDSGVFSETERADLMAKVDYLLRPLSDLRDRTELTTYEAQLNTGNWETDMSAGASFLAMAFPDLPHARTMLDNGRVVLDGQLKYTVREDGGWPESFRYHSAAMARFSAYAKALRNNTAENWFTGDSKLKKMYEFLINVQTPPYEYFANRISTPPIGDHILTPGDEFALLGVYFGELGATNSELGSHAYQTWERAGKPFTNYWGEAVALENFFSPIEPGDSQAPLNLVSNDSARPWGLAVMRDHFGQDNESYLALVANENAIGHLHNDQGSFIMYADKTPLVMDPGIESYFDSTKNWYVSSAAHSTLQFKSAGTYRDTPSSSTWEAPLFTSAPMDLARISVANPAGAGRQYRNLAYVKDDIDAYVIWDQIKGTTDGVRFNLPVAASGSAITGSTALSSGFYSMDLQTTVLQPGGATITQEFGRSAPQLPKNGDGTQLNYLRIEATRGQNLLTVLYPVRKGEPGITTEEVPVDVTGVQVHRIHTPNGGTATIVVNNTDTDQQVGVPTTTSLVDLQTGATAAPAAGVAPASVPANSMHIFKTVKVDQTIAFDALPAKVFGDAPFGISALASSGLPVQFTVAGSCALADAQVQITAAGECTITANQPGDAGTNPAAAVTRTFAIAKGDQSITFGPLPGKTFGDADFTIAATSSSGLPVQFTAAGVCTIAQSTVHLTGSGNCRITAMQPGNENINPGPAVDQLFSVAPPILDSFNRANGAVGSNWTGATSQLLYRIAGNVLDVQAGGPLIFKTVFGPTQEASVTLTTIDPRSPSQGVLLKTQSSTLETAGAISVVYDPVAKAARVATLRLGSATWTPYPAKGVTFNNGDRLTARATNTGDVLVYRNNQLLTTVTLNAADKAFFNAKGGRTGIWTGLAAAAALDDFAAGTIG